jgi:hypothetical protein
MHLACRVRQVTRARTAEDKFSFRPGRWWVAPVGRYQSAFTLTLVDDARQATRRCSDVQADAATTTVVPYGAAAAIGGGASSEHVGAAGAAVEEDGGTWDPQQHHQLAGACMSRVPVAAGVWNVTFRVPDGVPSPLQSIRCRQTPGAFLLVGG